MLHPLEFMKLHKYLWTFYLETFEFYSELSAGIRNAKYASQSLYQATAHYPED